MEPHTGLLDPRKEHLNYWLSRCWMVVEQAFGSLKTCWRSLGVHVEIRLRNHPSFVAAAYMLHDIGEVRRKALDSRTGPTLDSALGEAVLPAKHNRQSHHVVSLIRESLADHFQGQHTAGGEQL